MSYATFERFELYLTLDDALSASHHGECRFDVDALLKRHYIAVQLDRISCAKIREELREVGAWSEVELANDEENRARIVWCAACNIREEYTEVQS